MHYPNSFSITDAAKNSNELYKSGIKIFFVLVCVVSYMIITILIQNCEYYDHIRRIANLI